MLSTLRQESSIVHSVSFTSLPRFQEEHLMPPLWWSQHPSTQSIPGQELFESSLTRPRIGNAGSEEGLGIEIKMQPSMEEAALPHWPWPSQAKCFTKQERVSP